MCDEKQITTKVCKCCGKDLPVTEFKHHRISKDGYANVCNACKANSKVEGGNPKLIGITPRELIDELRIRGYHGKLVYVQKHEINL